MKWPERFIPYLFALIVLLSFALRYPALSLRPMHTDEAVNAAKFGQLLEGEGYQYNREEYHGPTLIYLSYIPAWLSGAGTYQELSESILRTLPLVISTLTLLLFLLLVRSLSWSVATATVALTALSPAITFYSIYYIHEMLLVCCAFGAIISLYRYYRQPTWFAAALGGVFLGVMYATKETWLMILLAIAGAAFLSGLTGNRRLSAAWHDLKGKISLGHMLLMGGIAAVIGGLFYSSLLTHPRGILDSFLTFGNYLTQATGAGEVHVHPWHYYLSLLFLPDTSNGIVWGETLIAILAVVGAIGIFRDRWVPESGRSFLRFILFFTVILIILFSIAPYKTPWNMLIFYQGMLFLAGAGLIALFRVVTRKPVRYTLLCVLSAGLLHLGWQSYHALYTQNAEPGNPYTYAQTTHHVERVADRVDQVTRAHPDGLHMRIHVHWPGSDYWPLPWYLRNMPNVGWWSEVPENIPPAELILASEQFKAPLLRQLYQVPPPGKRELYVPLLETTAELRPGEPVIGFVGKELWDRYQNSQSAEKR